MICEQCKLDRPEKDFIPKQTACYRCVYKNKTKRIKKIDKSKFCRICHNEIINEEDCKFRQKTVYCSYECADIGHKNQLDNHWIRRLRNIDLPY